MPWASHPRPRNAHCELGLIGRRAGSGTATKRWGRVVISCDLALCGFDILRKLIVCRSASLAGGAPRWAVIRWLIEEPCEARWDLRRHQVSEDPSQFLSELLS